MEWSKGSRDGFRMKKGKYREGVRKEGGSNKGERRDVRMELGRREEEEGLENRG